VSGELCFGSSAFSAAGRAAGLAEGSAITASPEITCLTWAKWTSYRHTVQRETGGVDKASAVFGGSAGKPCFAVERMQKTQDRWPKHKTKVPTSSRASTTGRNLEAAIACDNGLFARRVERCRLNDPECALRCAPG